MTETNYGYNKNITIKTKIPWNRLTKAEKEEIINNSNKRKEEKQRLDNIKNADIITGRQKTQENSWE